MAVFFLTPLLDAAVARLKVLPGLSFNPKLVQRGDLSWYAENFVEALPFELPAVLVWAPDGVMVGVEGTEAEGYTVCTGEVGTWGRIRVGVVDAWDDAVLDLYARRIAYMEEVANRLIGAAGTGYDLGAVISGYQLFYVKPTRIEPVAAEDDLVSQEGTRRLWAGAVDLSFSGRAVR